jgi:hypothetical protein
MLSLQRRDGRTCGYQGTGFTRVDLSSYRHHYYWRGYHLQVKRFKMRAWRWSPKTTVALKRAPYGVVSPWILSNFQHHVCQGLTNSSDPYRKHLVISKQNLVRGLSLTMTTRSTHRKVSPLVSMPSKACSQTKRY